MTKAGLQPSPLMLVVDDSRTQRRIVCTLLARWGYRAMEAASGEDALVLCRRYSFDIVLSDWMMPGMSGLEFCRAFRLLPREGYGYFVLLTSKSRKDEVAQGLDMGADDFLSKPVDADELRARIKAGERILRMQAELTDKNRLLGSALTELRGIYDSLDRDLVEARQIQQALVRDRHRDFGAAAISLLLKPSGHVGGDLVGYFQPLPDVLGFFAIDVSGHGVASAMMAARLAGMMSAAVPGGNVSLAMTGGAAELWPPEAVAARLNRMFLDEMQVDQYITCIYGQIELHSGRVQLVQAGHPHPCLLGADGLVRRVGGGGLPVGLIAGAEYDRTEFHMAPGDRLFLMSDGLTECMGPGGAELGEAGLTAIVSRHRHLDGPQLLDALEWELERFAGGPEFPDDVSAVLIAYRGPPSEPQQ